MTRPYLNAFVSVDRLREVLAYCPDTGTFTWKVQRGPMKPGNKAGKVTPRGYVQIGYGRKCFMAHRLAWALHYGEWPTLDIDHKNRIPSDNRIDNLRLATQSQNNANQGVYSTNTHGAKGVSRLRYGSWQAQIQVNGKSHYLGAFREKDDAIAAYAAAARRFFGEFASAGGPP